MIARKDKMTEFSAPNHGQCTGPLRAQVQVADCDAAAASITVEQVFELHCRIVSTLFNAWLTDHSIWHDIDRCHYCFQFLIFISTTINWPKPNNAFKNGFLTQCKRIFFSSVSLNIPGQFSFASADPDCHGTIGRARSKRARLWALHCAFNGETIPVESHPEQAERRLSELVEQVSRKEVKCFTRSWFTLHYNRL